MIVSEVPLVMTFRQIFSIRGTTKYWYRWLRVPQGKKVEKHCPKLVFYSQYNLIHYFFLTFFLSLMDPFPLTMILQPVSCSSCFVVIPRGPRIRPTKLNWKKKSKANIKNQEVMGEIRGAQLKPDSGPKISFCNVHGPKKISFYLFKPSTCILGTFSCG